MKPSVNTLTEDQAVAELVALVDTRPSEDQVLEFNVWTRDNTFRKDQLEAHIIRLQNLTKKEDAPPQHLQPEVAKSAEPVEKSPEKEKAVAKRKTPKEKMESWAKSYHERIDRLERTPSVASLRSDASTLKSRMHNLAREFHLTLPELRPIPPLPPVKAQAPKPSKVDEVLDKHLPRREEAHPYEPPTLEQLGITTAARAREVGEALLAAQDPPQEKHVPPWDIPTVALVHVEDPPDQAPEPSYTALEIARYLARSFWPLCQQIEELPDREQIRPALDVIYSRLQVAYALLDKAGAEQAG